MWLRWEPRVTNVLTAAAAYDAEADKSADTGAEDLRDLVGKLKDVADGRLDETTARALFDTAVRWASLAADVEKTYNDEETRKKVTDAVGKLRAAFGGR
jgi:hypothetical protein